MEKINRIESNDGIVLQRFRLEDCKDGELVSVGEPTDATNVYFDNIVGFVWKKDSGIRSGQNFEHLTKCEEVWKSPDVVPYEGNAADIAKCGY